MSWGQDLVNFIFPAECHICGAKLNVKEKYLCARCESALPRTGFHRLADNPMEQRFAGQFPFEKATGLFFYSRGSGLSELVQDMKYRSFPGIGRYLGKLAARELFSTGFFSNIDIVTCVPMHWFKQAQRGYNQAEEIAKGICNELDIPFSRGLKMVRRRKPQAKLGLRARLSNAENIFKARADIDLNGKGVLLVDDICTTGTTLGEAGRTLMKEWPGATLTMLTIGVTF